MYFQKLDSFPWLCEPGWVKDEMAAEICDWATLSDALRFFKAGLQMLAPTPRASGGYGPEIVYIQGHHFNMIEESTESILLPK